MIERLKELEKKAPKGPWKCDRDDIKMRVSPCMVNVFKAFTADDAEFIVALRNAAPLLIAVAEAAEKMECEVCGDQGWATWEREDGSEYPVECSVCGKVRAALRALKESKS